MSDSWNKLLLANRLYGNVININHFLVCCHMTGGTFYELLKVSQERFDFCKTGTFKAREKRGGISWASFLLGEGGNIQDLQATLKETIEHFNANFQKVGKMDDQLVHNFNILAKVVNGIEGQEQLFKDVLLELETGMQLLDQRMSFMVLKLQHFTALSTILHTSHFHENIILLERALFKNNVCSFTSCETRIFSTQVGPIITTHRELLAKLPVGLMSQHIIIRLVDNQTNTGYKHHSNWRSEEQICDGRKA